MIEHNGKEAPILPEEMNPGDTDTFYISWTDKLNGATLASDTWTLPTGFTQVSAASNISAVSNGITYLNSNSVTVSTTLTSGKHLLSNNAVFSDAREITRSLYVVLDANL